MSELEWFLLWVCLALCALVYALTLEYIGHRRYYYRKDLDELANIPYACRLLAEALEIEAPGEKVEQYVSWAIKERLAKETIHPRCYGDWS